MAAITWARDETHDDDDESEDETVCSNEAPDAAAIELLPDALLDTRTWASAKSAPSVAPTSTSLVRSVQ